MNGQKHISLQHYNCNYALIMTKHILTIIFFAAALCLPLTAQATESLEAPKATAIEDARGEIAVTQQGKNIKVQNACGKTLQVYNVTGALVATYRIDSDDKTITLNVGRGCYIVKVGDVTRKITINH